MITINFSSRDYRTVQRFRTAVVAGNVLLAVIAIVIISVGLSMRAEMSAMVKKVTEMEASEEKIRPVLSERDRIIKDLSAMSGLTESRRFSWTELFTNIEKVSPAGVALEKVECNPKDRSISLDGAALSPESLRTLMVGLETSLAFKDPYLKHQSVDKGSISFNVVAFYRGHKAAEVAQRK